MRKTFYTIASATLSILIHLVVLGFADRVAIKAFSQVPLDDKKAPKRLRLQTINVRKRVFKRPAPKVQSERTKKQLLEAVRNSKRIEKIFETNELVRKPKPKLRLAGLGRNILAPKLPTPTPPREASAPRPAIVAIDAQKLSPDRLALQRPLVPKLPRVQAPDQMLPSLVVSGDLRSAVGNTYNVGMRLTLPGFGALRVGDLPPEAFGEEEMGAEGRRTAFAPLAKPPPLPGIGGLVGGRRATVGGKEILKLDKMLSVSMTVFEERQGGGYYRIDISPNPESDRLRGVPKDVVFVIDCSTSISAQKLAQFRVSAFEGLEYLSKRDRFNIVSFRERSAGLFEAPVPVTEENLKTAQEFVKKLQRGGMTDVFAGIAPSVGKRAESGAAERPLLLFLMSDGKSTVRTSLKNDDFIRKIVNMNRADVSIYSFSAGKSANLQLLDFLAYHNRGMSLHEQELKQFRPQLVNFISTHTDLIVEDLSYHAADELGAEVFPKRLPHLYRGETLSIYGRYPAGLKEVVISLLGQDAEGKPEELIFRGKIKDSPRGSQQLALDWAAQKVFHLMGVRTLAPSPEVDAQIRQTATKFNLFVPY